MASFAELRQLCWIMLCQLQSDAVASGMNEDKINSLGANV